jgi:hypothetical protein
MTPRFYILWPPSNINYYDGGNKTVDVDWTLSRDADISQADIDYFAYQGIPVVPLDSWINPSTWTGPGAVAAMIWPADNRTANLFQTAAQTQDNNNLLVGQGIEMMRWVRPGSCVSSSTPPTRRSATTEGRNRSGGRTSGPANISGANWLFATAYIDASATAMRRWHPGAGVFGSASPRQFNLCPDLSRTRRPW